MASCSRCSSIPPSYPETGVLRLAPPLAHTQASLRGHPERVGIISTSPAAGLLAFRISGEILDRFATGLDDVLGGSELHDTRSHFSRPESPNPRLTRGCAGASLKT